MGTATATAEVVNRMKQAKVKNFSHLKLFFFSQGCEMYIFYTVLSTYKGYTLAIMLYTAWSSENNLCCSLDFLTIQLC